jgi:8-oxo-dGTP pyrophosphatase MutT (NUDIX family)
MACSHGESSFQHALPKSRLGTSHATLEAYDEAVKQSGRRDQTQIPTEFSLVVLLSPNYIHQRQQGKSSSISILLGKKLRGFGKGFYNCFGGKLEKHLDEHKHPARGAVREIEEETGIPIPLEVMEHGYVGTLNFTFDDWEVNKAMKVYLYCVLLTSSGGQEEDEHNTLKPDDLAKVVIEPGIIRGCEEIEPMWLYNVYEVPLEEMFADDSIWLTMLLSHYDHFFSTQKVSDDQIPVQRKLLFDAWFHFQAGGAESNKVLHHHIKMNTPNTMLCSASPPEVTETKYTLEKQLFHALHMNQIYSPSVKEFKENWAMANAVRRHLGDQVEYVIDVAGGHGALGE